MNISNVKTVEAMFLSLFTIGRYSEIYIYNFHLNQNYFLTINNYNVEIS